MLELDSRANKKNIFKNYGRHSVPGFKHWMMFRRDLRESSLLLRTSRTDETPNLSDVFLFYSIRRRSLIEKLCHTKLLQSCSTPWALLAQEDKLRGSEFSVHGLQISDRRLHRCTLTPRAFGAST